MIRDVVDMIVEVPAGSRNKYEFDADRLTMRLKRQLPQGLVYPGDYGFIPGTCAEDGDPLDIMLLIDEPTFPGCCVAAVPLGVLWMEDDHGRDPKIIAVLPERAERESLADISDLPPPVCAEIEQFFTVYKELEPEKFSTTAGFDGGDAARAEIAQALKTFSEQAPDLTPASAGGG